MTTFEFPEGEDRFGQDDPARPSHGSSGDLTPTEVADAMAVHGLLAIRQPNESARIEARIERAIATIRRMNSARRHDWRKRLAWVGGSAGIAAAILIALFAVPEGSDSSAYAALESIRGSARQGGRSYRVRFEMDSPGDPGPALAPRETDRVIRKPMSAAELSLGSEGRWTIVVAPSNLPRARGAFGFDGQRYWAVAFDGTIRSAPTTKELRVPPFIAVLENGSVDGEEDIDLLTLDSMLAKLDKGYKVSFDSEGDRLDRQGRAVTVVTAERKGTRDVRAPQMVRIVADSSTFEVLKANWQWTELPPQPSGQGVSPAKPRIKRIFLELTDAPPHEDGWFTPDLHASRLAEMPRPMGPPRPGAAGNAR